MSGFLGGAVPPGVAQLVATLQDLVRAAYANNEELHRISLGAAVLPSYAVAGLPTVTSASAGNMAFASNARNPGQGAGAGTGCPVFVDSTGVWRAVWSGVAPTV